MTGHQRILIFSRNGDQHAPIVDQLKQQYDVVFSETLESSLELLRDDDFAALFLLGEHTTSASILLEAGGLLEQIHDGLALLDYELNIQWCNAKLKHLSGRDEDFLGRNFFEAFNSPEILGPDFCPFHTALGSGEAAHSTLRTGDKYFELHTTPVYEHDDELPSSLVVMVRDVSTEVLEQQKLDAIYQAGMELGDLSPQEILEMSVEDRVDLLKQKIIHFTKGLLGFQTVEIRLLDRKTKCLELLLTDGMEKVASDRDLQAEPQGNGVTGFVAATGKSYLCEDTQNDPLYLIGAKDARSSLTVPLILHDEITGTFNVESTEPGSFSENDLKFLELFSREVAVALNTLELLVTEKVTTATESTDRIMREVAEPVDEILNDAAWILERYIGHEPEVCERLQHILRHTRDIKQLIQKVGETIKPKAVPATLPEPPTRPAMQNKRILVVDSDETVRRAAHELLGRFGCDVETAHNGEESFLMVRSFHYDAVLADIRLPDMTGFDCFAKLREIHEHLPVILMTGFGYDPSHSIVKARQMGLKSVLYKPFRLDQLLTEVEKAVASPTELAETQ